MRLLTRAPHPPDWLENGLTRLDELPWGGIYGIAVGFGMVPAWLRLCNRECSDWTLIWFFFCVLFSLRLVPAMVRMLVPFSESVKSEWEQRRQLGKRFDSYQGRKLYWLGVGLASYMVAFREFRAPCVLLAAGCLVAGALGLSAWHRVKSQRLRDVPAPVKGNENVLKDS